MEYNKRILQSFCLTGIMCVLCVVLFIVMNGTARAMSSAPMETTPPPIPSMQTVRNGNYEYQIVDENSKKAWLTKVYNYGEEVELPSIVDGYNIVGIGCRELELDYDQRSRDYFDFEKVTLFSEKDNTTVKKLIIPDGVNIIEPVAFNEMSGLEYLELPDSLMYIYPYNFCNINIKHLKMAGKTTIDDEFQCFQGSIDKLTVRKCNKDEDYLRRIGNISVYEDIDLSHVPLGVGSAKVNELIVKQQIKKIWFTSGEYNHVILENPKTEVSYDQEDAEVGKISAKKIKVKAKKKSGKYIFSWNPLNILVRKQTYGKEPGPGVKTYKPKSETTYTVKVKNKNGKYKKLKMTKKTKITIKKKVKIKVEATCQLPEGRFWDFPVEK